MPGCAAIGCNNRSEKGYTMKCFPRDPVLRQIWKDRVGRADWEPSNNSFLCHAHFAPNQWMVTQCGRLKLRKGALPSIFRVVSTRKSPNKRRRLGTDGRSEDDEIGVEVLETDNDNYVYVESSEKVQDFGEESNVFLNSQNFSTVQNIRENDKLLSNKVYQIISTGSLNNQQQENLIIISDENDAGTFINNSNNYIIINNENEDTNNYILPIESTNNQIPTNARVKVEVKAEADDKDSTDDIYNEVESNMERIYEGINTDDSMGQNCTKSYIDLNEQSSEIQEIDRSTESNIKLSFHNTHSVLNGKTIVSINHETENSEGHTAHLENSISTCLKNNGINNGVLSAKEINDDEELKKQQNQVIPNIEAVFIRKKKVREETMKSIERILSDTVDETLEKSQSSDDENCMSDLSSINSRLNHDRQNKSESSKFTIKVSGVIEDVSDIMRDFGSKPSLECSLEENKKQRQDYGDACITSVIRLDNKLPKIIKTEKLSKSESDGNLSDELVKNSIKFQLKQERIDINSTDSELNIEDFQGQGQDQHHQDENNQDHLQSQDQDCYENYSEDSSRRDIMRSRSSESESKDDLKLKLKKQQKIILKLTDHLSPCKDIETKLKLIKKEIEMKNREISTLKTKLQRKEIMDKKLLMHQGRSDRNFTAMQAIIKDLTNKVKTIEDVNRKLSRSISVENQNKKNLEHQVRSREKTIKELNWKVDKASKLLERAERNATTYKKRMNNMRSLMRRKHNIVEKHTPFHILLSDHSKHEFSEESLQTAAEIQKECGNKGYEKLLYFSFPLPSSRTLRRRFQKEFLSPNDTADSLDTSNLDESLFYRNNLIITNLKNELSGYDINEMNCRDSGFTIQGTVQDILNENNYSELMNEDEVMSESELKEQLNSFSNFKM